MNDGEIWIALKVLLENGGVLKEFITICFENKVSKSDYMMMCEEMWNMCPLNKDNEEK